MNKNERLKKSSFMLLFCGMAFLIVGIILLFTENVNWIFIVCITLGSVLVFIGIIVIVVYGISCLIGKLQKESPRIIEESKQSLTNIANKASSFIGRFAKNIKNEFSDEPLNCKRCGAPLAKTDRVCKYCGGDN